jgi:Fis family transcriptional regulator
MHPEHSSPTSGQLDALVRQMLKAGIQFAEAVREFKKKVLLIVLRDLNWNETKAARVLGIHRNTLARSLRELGLDARTLRKTERRPTQGIRPEAPKKIAT